MTKTLNIVNTNGTEKIACDNEMMTKTSKTSTATKQIKIMTLPYKHAKET